MLTVKIDRAKRGIVRMRLERALLLEKLEEKSPAHIDGSEGSESEMSSVSSLFLSPFDFFCFATLPSISILSKSVLAKHSIT